jgi:hypothetical protein
MAQNIKLANRYKLQLTRQSKLAQTIKLSICVWDAHEKLSENNDNCLSSFSWDQKWLLPYSKQFTQWLPYQSMLYWVNQTNKSEIDRQNGGLLLQENLYSQFLNCITLLVVVANDARLQCFSVIPICQYTKIYFGVFIVAPCILKST